MYGKNEQKKIAIIRAPFSYRYQVLDIGEETIITYLLGYFKAIGFKCFQVFDFHLNRELNTLQIVEYCATDYVLVVRETGEMVHYVKKLAQILSTTGANVWVYGQTGRLRLLPDWPKHIKIVHHNESYLAACLNLNDDGPQFNGHLTLESYYLNTEIKDWQIKRFKGTIETTRGCHYSCNFCFINSGKNYDKKWEVRPNESIISDINHYWKLGVRDIVFYDSDFLGVDRQYYEKKQELLKEIIERFPNLRYRIYCRADNLLKFDKFELLKKSGLVQVFIGVESFDQEDLKALNKGVDVESLFTCIERLRELKIYMNLSFIIFNHNTTLETLKTNINAIKALLKKGSKYFGMPNFIFSFESQWNEKGMLKQNLSRKTYIWKDIEQKEQPMKGCAFNTNFEPLMEIYRLLSYECSRKMTEISQSQNNSAYEYGPEERWLSGLSEFCIETMENFLYKYESGELTLETLENEREFLFKEIKENYKILPLYKQKLSTYDTHASAINYKKDTEMVEEDEYWKMQIP